MARRILCLKCGDPWRPHHEDVHSGFTHRKVYVSQVGLPADHGMTLIVGGSPAKFEPLNEIVCDHCNEVVTGQVVVCVSIIPPERLLGDWEQEYGTVLDEQAMKAYRVLSNDNRD